MSRSLKSAGIITHGQSATPGVWMRRISVRGQWVYLYRAVDKQGRTVDFLLSKRRDVAAAKRFFSRATKQHGAPRVITLDGYAASHRAVDKLKTSGILPRRVQVRSCKYLNNGSAMDTAGFLVVPVIYIKPSPLKRTWSVRLGAFARNIASSSV
jgi:hypothetical protein